MEETSRQAYLRAMGVHVYFPRYVLDGAKVSPEYNFLDTPDLSAETPEPREPQEPRQPRQPREPREPGKVASLESSLPTAPSTHQEIPRFRSKNPDRPVIDLGNHGKERTRSVSVNQKPLTSALESEAAAVNPQARERREAVSVAGTMRFDLGYFMTARGVAILYEIPPLAKDEDKARAKKLLSAILLACGLNAGQHSPRPVHEAFNWPLENDLGLSSSDQAGAAALAGFIRRRHDGDRFEELIVFAGVVEPLIAELALNMPFQQTLLASLSAMLSFASLKREVWADLQPVLARIENHKI